MKKFYLMIFAVITLAGMLAISGCSGNSDSGTSQNKENSNDQTAQQKEEGTLNQHEYVDLGLPSGTKWATCNVGATKPEENGDYIAWGEAKKHDNNSYCLKFYEYSNNKENCKSSGDPKLTKYCYDPEFGDNGFTDKLIALEISDDAATANWGKEWRMPTKSDFEELLSKCTWVWQSNGCKVTGPNGNSIFLPAAGRCEGMEIYSKSSGCYWSCSLYDGSEEPSGTLNAWCLKFDADGEPQVCGGLRYDGRFVRPVYVSQN